MSETSTAELKDRIDAIEGGYEIFLGFAAKGLKGEPGTGGELRDCLQRMDLAMDGLGEFLLALVGERHLEPSLPYDAYFEVVGQDARRAQLAIRLVMAQPGISSQVIDNLNASVHLRALLTDLFLVDEILRPRASDAIPAAALVRDEPPPSDSSSTP